jgi:hypothetical protein
MFPTGSAVIFLIAFCSSWKSLSKCGQVSTIYLPPEHGNRRHAALIRPVMPRQEDRFLFFPDARALQAYPENRCVTGMRGAESGKPADFRESRIRV